MLSDKARIAELEAELASLKSQIKPSALQPTSAPKPVDDEGVQFFKPLTEAAGDFTWPTEDELRQLHAIVLNRHPVLLGPDARFGYRSDIVEEHWRDFSRSFQRIAHLWRRAEPDPRRDAIFWADECSGWLRRAGHDDSAVWTLAYAGAAIAHRDIAFELGETARTWELKFALSPDENFYIGNERHRGFRSGNAWREWLEAKTG